MADIKNELRSILDYYQHPPKNSETLIQKYAEALAYYPFNRVKNAIRTVAQDAGRFFPTLQEIKGLIGHGEATQREACQWCHHGRIFAKQKETGFGFAFRCRCQAGQDLAPSVPTWNSSLHAEQYERLK